MFEKEIRVIGIDDSPFDKFRQKDALVVGVIMRGGSWIEGILSTRVDVDGANATDKIIQMINICKFKPQLQCIFLNGIAVAGFNVIDIRKLNNKTGLPVVIIIRNMPDIQKIKRALIRLKSKNNIKLIEKAGKVVKINNVFVQLAGIKEYEAREILGIVCTRSLLPEPLRLAHIIASGIVSGESKGRA